MRARPADLAHDLAPPGSVLQAEVGEARILVGSAAERPMVLALAVLDRKIIDGGDAQPHQTVLVKLPVLVAVTTEPVTAIVVPLVGEPHGDAVVAERPYLLDQSVVELLIPLAP